MKVLITGGTRGIGLACCERFLRENADVVATWSHDEKAYIAASAMLKDVRFVRADVSDEQAVKELIEGMGSLDVLVNNAGICLSGQVQDITLSAWERQMSVNAGGAFLTTKYAVKKMIGKGGAIINVASVWGETGGSCESAYSATKGALIAFTKALAKELAPAGITVNCVSPGAIDTVMNASLSMEEREQLCKDIPMGRFGLPEEVAELIFFLSKQKYITGQDIGINGGWYC